MCGIAGIVGRTPHVFTDKLKSLMSHRGPDNTQLSELRASSASIQLLHHRLSIIDLSDEANQPFFDESKRYALIFNGEIYNYKELRTELENLGEKFRTSSDTEVLLKCLIKFGEQALPKLNGMFAIAFFDLQNESCFIARDPFGEKPFYYILDKNKFIFASEIKFILEASGRKFKINGPVLGDYFSSHFLETKEDETFFHGIWKLPPGSFARFSLKQSFQFKPQRYYRPSVNAPEIKDAYHASELIKQSIYHSVDIRLRSDVPVGLFLSGGIDSSILAAVSSELSEKQNSEIKFLSIVSDDPSTDESSFVDMVSKHLKKESIKVNVQNDAQSFWKLLPKIVWHNDEPIISFSSIAYYKMIEAAKAQGLKVLLTGQGADEAFLGYKKFKFWHYKNLLKKGRVDKLAWAGLSELKNSDLFESFSFAEASRYLPGGTSSFKTRAWGETLQKVRRTTGRDTVSLKQTQLDDLLHYSVPVLLHYEDRLSMAYGAEVRVPFLDHHIVDIGMALQDDLKIKNGFSKYILRKTFEPMLPKEVIWRRDKKGFTIPQEQWMKKDLSTEINNMFQGDMISYDLKLLKKQQNLDDYRDYQESKTKILGFKDIFARISVETWLNVYGPYIEREVYL
jgi:asparagine synthase (glutamine-hydrolysing)